MPGLSLLDRYLLRFFKQYNPITSPDLGFRTRTSRLIAVLAITRLILVIRLLMGDIYKFECKALLLTSEMLYLYKKLTPTVNVEMQSST